jgi:hypothetical protein
MALAGQPVMYIFHLLSLCLVDLFLFSYWQEGSAAEGVSREMR